MELVVFVAKLPRSDTFLQSSSFCCRSIFICSAYVQRSSVSGTWAESRGLISKREVSTYENI